MTQVIGIVNITKDSFSDGGRFLQPDRALRHARELVAAGAAVIDLGAESSNPDGEDITAAEELARLAPVLRALKDDGVAVSVDTRKPEVMSAAVAAGADYINDVTALGHTDAQRALRGSAARIVLMYARHAEAQGLEATADRGGRATRAPARRADPWTIMDEILVFFRERIAELEQAGIAAERLVLDPGMGFFLSHDPAISLAVLRDLRRLAELGRPICVSTSRKSFIGAALESAENPRGVEERGAGTLATEIWAALQGVTYIRTHDVRALSDGLRMLDAIQGAGVRPSATPQA